MKLRNSFFPLVGLKLLLLFLAVTLSCLATASISYANGRVLDYQVKDAEPNTDVDSVGSWTFMVTVRSGLGNSSANFVLDVQPSNPFLSIMSWVTVTMFVALVVLGIYPLIASRMARLKLK